MKAMEQWRSQDLAKEYTEKATNPNINWYEYEVNLPDVLALIPKDSMNILDFGSGPGDVTAIIKSKFPEARVEGCDSSQAMLDLAKAKFPDIKFFPWDGANDLESGNDKYDCVVSKLTVHFIEDLPNLAAKIRAILKPSGNLVFSVPHPMRSSHEIGENSYWQQVEYDEEIGKYGITAVFIHRSIQSYFQAFADYGFVLTGLSEPSINTAQIQKHNVDAGYASVPRRLNWRFVKVG